MLKAGPVTILLSRPRNAIRSVAVKLDQDNRLAHSTSLARSSRLRNLTYGISRTTDVVTRSRQVFDFGTAAKSIMLVVFGHVGLPTSQHHLIMFAMDHRVPLDRIKRAAIGQNAWFPARKG